MFKQLISNLINHSTDLLFYGFAFIIVISVIVFVHEYGHYIVAKICGVKVESFSIGFGPELIGINDKSGTRWKISLIPVGGYVKMFGDANEASIPDNTKTLTEEEAKLSFHNKPLYKKAMIIAAGPLANFIFSIFVLTFLFFYEGQSHYLPIIGHVISGSAADQAGLRAGDEILKFNDSKIKYFEDIKYFIINNTSEKVSITFKRNDIIKLVDVIFTDINNSDQSKAKVKTLGIISSDKRVKENLSFIKAFYTSFIETYKIIYTTLNSLWQIITTKRTADDLGGPIRIAQYSVQSIKNGVLLWFMAIISINLGIVNLLPIPILDGGHLFNYLVQAILRKKELSIKYQKYTATIGMALLLLMMFFATYNDIKHIIKLH